MPLLIIISDNRCSLLKLCKKQLKNNKLLTIKKIND